MATNWDPERDEQTFKDRGIVDDQEVPQALTVSLARIWYENIGALHWALVWPAFRKNAKDELEEYGWHMVDIQQRAGSGDKLFFRHQHKLPTAGTTQIWSLTTLSDSATADHRTYILGYSEGWQSAGGNCITCICQVIDELVRDGVLPNTATVALQNARGQDMADPRKAVYHIAAAH
ncbi:hypothetical protein C8Q77DRAFT_1159856 [Trametes polyzona]|nr:hypothetical protein C8Q77DRAFT_1159856 [Trametes polyzona]